VSTAPYFGGKGIRYYASEQGQNRCARPTVVSYTAHTAAIDLDEDVAQSQKSHNARRDASMSLDQVLGAVGRGQLVQCGIFLIGLLVFTHCSQAEPVL